MPLETWQRELRRQFGREQRFQLKNIGAEPVFSEFHVTNPESKSTYRVAIRGTAPGDNYCSCPDFASNELGTCKHIEFTLAILEKRRGGKAALREGYQPAYSEVYLQYGARREVRFRPGSDCPAELARLAGRFFDAEGVLLADAIDKFPDFVEGAGRIDHELRCYDDALGCIAELRDAERRQQILAKAFPRGSKSAAFKNLLKTQLYAYQRDGAFFAARAGRCLIGDEMGLGKTIQAIAAAEIMAQHLGVERVLVVCPTSLKHQWEREIEKFAVRTTQVIGGMRPRRQDQWKADTFYKITNYDTVHADLDCIQEWSPDLVILDEAQRIKNWNTRTARSVKRIQSPYAVVLTGTPLENRLEELVSIVQFVDRYRLGPTYRLLHNHQVRDEHGKVVGYRNLDHIGQTLAPILVRRQKSQVLDQLPPRLDKYFYVPMTPQQMAHHKENMEIVARIVQKWRRYKFLSEADQRRLMIALQNMRMSCDSTYLLDQSSDYGVKADELATLLGEIWEQPNTKVVVFSQWVRMHELLERRFEDHDWQRVLFHGGVPGSQRKGLIDRFREDAECRAFLSTDAGGVGLNLQFATVVVNMDLPWNPAVLEQRIGRVHRLGQRLPVSVVNFVSKGTIEEGMLSVLKFKKSLFAGVLDGGDKDVFLGGSRLTKFMETVEKATTAIPEAVEESPSEPSPDEVEAEPQRRPVQSRTGPEPRAVLAQPSSPASDPWTGLLQTGLGLLQQVAAASRTPAGGGVANGNGIVQRDDRTGESFLRLPVPDPQVLERLLESVQLLLDRTRE
jgi:superfamily II DNA or RNA helicase